MIAALPLSVSAAGEYVPGNPRWSGYQNQVQWGRPAGAASGDSFEYEAQLPLTSKIKRVLSLQHELNAISILQRKRKHLFTILQYAQRRCPSAIFWS